MSKRLDEEPLTGLKTYSVVSCIDDIVHFCDTLLMNLQVNAIVFIQPFIWFSLIYVPSEWGIKGI